MALSLRAYLLTAAAAIVGLGCFYFIYLVRFESRRNYYTLGLLIAALSWMFASIMEVADLGLAAKSFWYMEQYFSLVCVPPLWLATSGHFCGLTKKALAPMLIPCFAISLALVALFATNPLHRLVFRSLSISAQGLAVKKESGPVYYMYLVFLFVGGATGLFIIGSNIKSMTRQLRSRSWYVFAALAIPLSAGLSDIFWPEFLGDLDAAPLSALASCALLYLGMARYRLMNPLPLARSDFIDQLADPVLVLDESLRVIYGNERAKALAAETPDGRVGGMESIVGSVLALSPGEDAFFEGRVYKVSIKSVTGSDKTEIARIVSLHDVTDLSEMNERLEAKVRERTIDLEKTARDLAEEVKKAKSQESRLKRSLEEKELLLREVNHRVKNNLQVISSLIKLQSMRVVSEEARSALDSSLKRVHAICLVHDRMYGQEHALDRVDAAAYLKDIVYPLATLGEGLGSEAKVSIDGGGIGLSLDLAINIGLIVNEAVTNAFKHAFRPGLGSELSVSLLEADDGGMVLEVRDDGPGLPRMDQISSGHGLGMSIIRTIAGRMGGELKVGPGPGGLISVAIPRSARIKSAAAAEGEG